MAIGCVLAEDLHLGSAVAGFFTKKSPALIDFACVAQLFCTDRGPPGFFDRLAGKLFRIGVPGNPRHYPLGIGTAEQGLDQCGRQPGAKAMLLVTHGKAVVQVVIAVQHDCHRILELCCRYAGTHILVVKHCHGFSLFVDQINMLAPAR